MDEDVGHAVLHGGYQPLVLLSELGVVCHCLLHLLLLCAMGGNAVREIRDAP